jgi:hypothetical protein
MTQSDYMAVAVVVVMVLVLVLVAVAVVVVMVLVSMCDPCWSKKTGSLLHIRSVLQLKVQYRFLAYGSYRR